jgi:hypothetical protein
MDAQDEVMERVGTAMALFHAGDRAGARRGFALIWDEVGTDGDPFHRCVLAHYLADVQDDLRDELAWDLRALEAAASLTDDRVQEHHASLRIRGFYPSLHLNLAEDYRRLGEPDKARHHLAEAETRADALADDDYGNGIRAALIRLAARLSDPDTTIR